MKSKIKYKFTHERLAAFANSFGEAHLDLACRAAFPLALTPELLYCLRENFVPDAPFIAVADILLFLCQPVGYQLYELEGEVRNELFVYLKKRLRNQRLYKQQLHKLSDFMVAYIRQQLKTNDYADEDLGATPHWTALAYISPKQAVHDIANTFKEVLHEKLENLVQFSSLMESYADTEPLINSGFQPLLTLSRGLDAKARGDEEMAEAEFEKLRQEYGNQLEVAGVKFDIPIPGVELSNFEFEVVTVNRRGEIIKQETKQARYFTEYLGDNIKLEMVAIPGGKFMMGSADGEGHKDEYPQHEVNVPPFFMAKYLVTQAQWKAVAALPKIERDLEPEPSHFSGDDLPVDSISWYDAEEFCKRLSQKTGRQYRLPTEAEWEYACRAKTTTPFHFGETITGKLANYDASETFSKEPKGEYRQKTTSVKTFLPNAFGLFDMHGNLWEWCADIWQDNYEGAPTDGSEWINQIDNDNHFRVLRGGSWDDYPGNCRSANRIRNDPGNDDNDGFRVVCGAAARIL
ncbi:SUMF1/EgtB/PvdO family nonheme iron enzyme [Nostoc sp. CHAB 5836]|uniref:formylglycine-generating enzyme family protein n=1 Tax=Nostoc sp. CHAB 5836 TaxID=2780404 RepID=UPI001E595EBF|nr:formylglycine-generating enzyme family protein [Nostoc sp. CHAB 5836]MCC5618378.1 SUMF1/EgtB/PvdO family nonheme iron enzyme [Nostoc sp. CHAB 5836]